MPLLPYRMSGMLGYENIPFTATKLKMPSFSKSCFPRVEGTD